MESSGQKSTQKAAQNDSFCYTKTIEILNWRTADPISVKLVQYLYHLNTDGVNQMKGNRGHIKEKTKTNTRNIYSIFFLGKSLIGPIQVNCFGMGYSRRKNQTGGGRRVETYSFFEKPLDLFSFFSVSLEISGKAKLNLWKFGKIIYVTSLGNFKAKRRL